MTTELSKPELKVLHKITGLPLDEVKKLTDKQQLFLLAKQGGDTDAGTARSLDLQPNTPGTWKRTSDSFKRAYNAVVLVKEQKVIAATTFDRDKFIDDTLVDEALKKLGAILSLDIDDTTDAAIIAQVRQAAVTVLHDRGILLDAETDPNRVTVVIQEFIDAGTKYKPQWRQIQAQPAVVETTAKLVGSA